MIDLSAPRKIFNSYYRREIDLERFQDIEPSEKEEIIMMNRRAIMEEVIYDRYKQELIKAAKMVNNGWSDSSVEAAIKYAEVRLAEDLRVLDSILKKFEES